MRPYTRTHNCEVSRDVYLAAGHELLLEPRSVKPQGDVRPKCCGSLVELRAGPAVHVGLHVGVGENHLSDEVSGGGERMKKGGGLR